MEQKTQTLTLKYFVYGTLKKGHGNHRIAGRPDKIEPALVVGNLRAGGVPFLELPEDNKLFMGTGSPAQDMKNLAKAKNAFERRFNYLEDFSIVKGEVFTYKGDAEYLATVTTRMDRLEGYNPNNPYYAVYTRIVTLTTDGTPVMVYDAVPNGFRLLGTPGNIVEF